MGNKLWLIKRDIINNQTCNSNKILPNKMKSIAYKMQKKSSAKKNHLLIYPKKKKSSIMQ